MSKYKVVFDVTERSNDKKYPRKLSQKATNALRHKLEDRLEDEINNGEKITATEYDINRAVYLPSEDVLFLIIHDGYSFEGDLFTNKERAHIKMTVTYLGNDARSDTREAKYNC